LLKHFARKEQFLFDKISKNLGRYRPKNNYAKNSNMMSNAAKSFNILSTSLSILHNFDNLQQNYFQTYIQLKIFRDFSKTVLFHVKQNYNVNVYTSNNIF